jgi:MFS family permease
MKIASLPAPLAGRLIFSFGFGFFLSMFTRSASNVLKQPMQADLMMGEEAISLALGTSFFIAFAIMQLPVGVLLDRYDPRKVNASLMLLAAGGALTMAFSQDAYWLTVGRIMMGAGFAAGMMGSLKVYSLWFPQDRLPTMNSIQFMIGVLGALSATKPTQLLLEWMSWRDFYTLFSGLTVLAAIILVTVAPRHDTPPNGETLAKQIGGIKRIYSDAYFWRVVPWMFLSVGISQGLGTLYVLPWLTEVADYSRSDAAYYLTLVAGVAALNFAFMGRFAESMAKRGFDHMTLPIAGLMSSMVLLGFLVIQVKFAVVPIWMFWTMSIGVTTLIFAGMAKAFPPELMGRVYTAFNLLGFLCTAVAQWLIGRILDLYPRTADGAASPEGYQAAFAMLLGVQVVGMLWYFWAKKSGFGKETMVDKAEAAAIAEGGP